MLTDEESFLFIVNTSSTAGAVPLLPQEKAFFMRRKQRKAPREAGQAKSFLNTVNHIKQIDKTSILMKFLNTFIG